LCIGCAAAAHAEERQRVAVVALNVLAPTGNREATHPCTDSYYRSARWAIIDHVLTRDATPLTGRVIELPVP
jgi:hypothetical protein